MLSAFWAPLSTTPDWTEPSGAKSAPTSLRNTPHLVPVMHEALNEYDSFRSSVKPHEEEI